MAAYLSPVFNDTQFDNNGVLLSGGQIYSYVAGSSTPLATYTSSSGSVAQSNPIILNARGEVTQPIWLSGGSVYKLRLFDSGNNFIREFDNVAGIGDNSITIDQWVASGVTPTYVSATSFTVPGDQTTAFHANRRIKATVTAGTVYGYIVSSVFGALTTVTVSLDSGSLDSGLSAVQLGLVTANNTSLPQIPNWVKEAMYQNDSVSARALADSSQGYGMINGTITATVNASALTIAIKNKAGNDPSSTDPVLIVFRSATLTSGSYNVRSVTAATSLTISSGSTLGTSNGVASTIDVLAIDNSGTVELAAINNLGSLVLSEDSVISTTAEGGAGGADSSGVVYSTTARSNVPVKPVGKVTSTQATAGTWATSPSNISIAPSRYSTADELKPALNASGSAPIYAARAWVNFNGTGVVAIRSSGNVSSITDNATGSWTVNLTTALIDANGSAVTGIGSIASASVTYSAGVEAITSSTIQILVQRTDGVDTDLTIICVSVYR